MRQRELVERRAMLSEIIKPVFAIRYSEYFEGDGALFFARKDDNDIDLFEMRLVDGEARLIFAATEEDRAKLAREGLPLPRPIRLTKSLR